jgi:hypothetical protein
MTAQQRSKRIKKLLDKEKTQTEKMWYLSYATEKTFLGGVLTKAPGFFTAVRNMVKLGVSPGGSVAGLEISKYRANKIPATALDRLLQKNEIDVFLGWKRNK